MNSTIALVIIIGVIACFLGLFLSFVPVGLWISALAANVKVSFFNLIGMRLRRVLPKKIVIPLIKATKGGVEVSVNQLEAHYLAGGNVDAVVNALIASHRASFDLPFERAAALREGKLGVMDYYDMQNVISDTNMREAISKGGKNKKQQNINTVSKNIEE